MLRKHLLLAIVSCEYLGNNTGLGSQGLSSIISGNILIKVVFNSRSQTLYGISAHNETIRRLIIF